MCKFAPTHRAADLFGWRAAGLEIVSNFAQRVEKTIGPRHATKSRNSKARTRVSEVGRATDCGTAMKTTPSQLPSRSRTAEPRSSHLAILERPADVPP
jgi:hypothetical protein